MNRTKRILFFSWILFLSTVAAIAQETFPNNGPQDKRPNYFAIVHANIQVDPTTLLKDATLIVKDNQIENVGIGIPIPSGIALIDANGKFIYPSFIDLYSNYGINPAKQASGRSNSYRNSQKGPYAWNDAVKTNFMAVENFEVTEKQAKQLMCGGIGMTLSSSLDGIFRGTCVLAYTGLGSEHQSIFKDKAATALSFNKGSSNQDYPGSAMGSVALIRQTYYDANWYAGQNKEYNIGLAQLNQYKNLPAIFEAENKLAILRAAKIGKEFGIPYIIKGKGDEYQRVGAILEAGNRLIIPLNFPKPYEVEDPFDAMNVSLADLKHWEMAPANAGIMQKNKVPFVITSYGLNDGNEFLKNLRKAVQYGLSEQEALTALTLRPAQWMGISQAAGSLKKGMQANFFVSSGSIFENGTEIEEHVVAGHRNILKQTTSASKKINGYYSISIPNFPFTAIQLSDPKVKKDNKIVGKDTFKMSVIENAGILTLSFDTAKKSGQVFRMDVWLAQAENNSLKNLNGMLFNPDGTRKAFVALFDSAYTASKKEEKTKNIEVGKVLYPFTEYGNEQLPLAETVVFKNATVWTNEKEGILVQTDVAISNGKILTIGKNLQVANAKTIDATGKHLTNGIIDEHSHIGIYRGVNECTQYSTAEVRIGDVINSEDINIYRQLSGGVIACQQLHGSCNPIGGQSSIIKLRWGLEPEKMKIAGADGFIKFALGENVKQSSSPFYTNRYPRSRMGVEQVYYDAFIRAKAYEKQMKANPAATRKDLELEALVEILNQKRFISCHSYVQSEINMLMHVGDSLGFKVNTFTHILEGYKVADKMKAHGASASTFADWWAYKYEVIDAIPQNAVILNKMGITTAINSDDAEMGRRLNQEAAKMIKYGNVSEQDAWKMVTLNPAKMLHLDKQTGSIAVGKDADLVLWSAHPLSIEAKAELTYVDGVCYFNRTADMAKRNEIEKERQRIIQLMIQAKLNGEKTEKKVSEPDPDYHCED
jgi:imidazolonepropionase-like amidohydrolase